METLYHPSFLPDHSPDQGNAVVATTLLYVVNTHPSVPPLAQAQPGGMSLSPLMGERQRSGGADTEPVKPLGDTLPTPASQQIKPLT